MLKTTLGKTILESVLLFFLANGLIYFGYLLGKQQPVQILKSQPSKKELTQTERLDITLGFLQEYPRWRYSICNKRNFEPMD